MDSCISMHILSLKEYKKKGGNGSLGTEVGFFIMYHFIHHKFHIMQMLHRPIKFNKNRNRTLVIT